VASVAAATDSISLTGREDICWFRSVAEATQCALRAANRRIEDVNFAEVHDCFTIAELCVMEAMGLVERGRSGLAVAEGLTALDGRFPINTSGGLKAKGHPVGATGIAQVCEVVTQLRGEAGDRQVRNARVGLAQNMGGTAGSCVVSLFEAL
jgi:acetyl-CoA C-acetyltransferase